jgi:phosphonate C-P lyase system protein PhnG
MPEAPKGPDPRGAASLKARLQSSIAAAGAEETAAMLDRLWAAGDFAVVRPPRNGLTMIAVVDPFDTPFYLGEILTTTAEVSLEGHLGHGACSGDEPERALLLAAVEAAELSGRAANFCGLGDFIAELARVHARRRDLEARVAAATEVSFESMKKESVDFGSLGGSDGPIPKGA